MTLVHIKKSATKSGETGAARPFSMLLIDKFFLIGALAGLFGSLVLGLYVWLMRSGLIAIDARYHSLRAYHATMQFYLFLTPFILGFLLQSGTKLLEINTPLPKLSRVILATTIIGALFMLFLPELKLGAFFISTACLCTGLYLLPGLFYSTIIIRLRFAIPAVFGLMSLALGAYLDLTDTRFSILIFWWGIAAIIFSTAQQFIAGVLKGERKGVLAFSVFLSAYFISGGLLAAGAFLSAPLWREASVFMLISITLFLYASGAASIIFRLKEPIGAAFLFAFVWAFTGAALVFFGELYFDAAVHAWGIGFAVTLIIAISLRLISWITDRQILKPQSVMVILTLWQAVAFVRTFHLYLGINSWLVWMATVGAVVSLAVWGGALLSGAFFLLRRQLQAFKKIGFNI